MAKWISDRALDLVLDDIATSDKEVICNQQPTTFFNCVWGDLWIPSEVVAVGDIVHPPTNNNFVYECVTGGTTGATEPGWATSQDVEFNDSTVTWKTHENYSLAIGDIASGMYTKSEGDIDGRKLVVDQISGVVTHKTGTVTHTALISTVTNSLNYVTVSTTTIPESNDVESGRTTILYAMTVVVRDPV